MDDMRRGRSKWVAPFCSDVGKGLERIFAMSFRTMCMKQPSGFPKSRSASGRGSIPQGQKTRATLRRLLQRYLTKSSTQRNTRLSSLSIQGKPD